MTEFPIYASAGAVSMSAKQVFKSLMAHRKHIHRQGSCVNDAQQHVHMPYATLCCYMSMMALTPLKLRCDRDYGPEPVSVSREISASADASGRNHRGSEGTVLTVFELVKVNTTNVSHISCKGQHNKCKSYLLLFRGHKAFKQAP
jgi:hypothetical protein